MTEWIKTLSDLLTPRALTPNPKDPGVVLLPDNVGAHALEPLLPFPARQRGHFVTRDLDELISYIAARAAQHAGHSEVYVDDTTDNVTAICNPGTPDNPSWNDDLAEFIRTPSSITAATLWLGTQITTTGSVVPQSALLDYLRDWLTQLEFSRDGKSIAPPDAYRLFADLTVDKLRSERSNREAAFDRERSSAERISASSGIPDRISIRGEPFRSLGTDDILIHIEAAAGSSEPSLRLRIAGWQATLDRATERTVVALREQLSEDHLIYRGTYSGPPRTASRCE